MKKRKKRKGREGRKEGRKEGREVTDPEGHDQMMFTVDAEEKNDEVERFAEERDI